MNSKIFSSVVYHRIMYSYNKRISLKIFLIGHWLGYAPRERDSEDTLLPSKNQMLTFIKPEQSIMER